MGTEQDVCWELASTAVAARCSSTELKDEREAVKGHIEGLLEIGVGADAGADRITTTLS